MNAFWKTQSRWVHWRKDDSYPPINAETGIARVIEDDSEAEETYRRMIEDGVPVVDEPRQPPQRA